MLSSGFSEPRAQASGFGEFCALGAPSSYLLSPGARQHLL